MPQTKSPLEAAVIQGHHFLLPVSTVNLVAGLAIVAFDSAPGWRLIGVVMAAAGFAFLVHWARHRDPARHPVVAAVRGDPQRVRWVHVAPQKSPLGSTERAVLHVGLQDRGVSIPVEDPALAHEAAAWILERCPHAIMIDAAELAAT